MRRQGQPNKQGEKVEEGRQEGQRRMKRRQENEGGIPKVEGKQIKERRKQS